MHGVNSACIDAVYCPLYRPYGQALASVCFEPGDPGYDEAVALKRRVGDPKW
jgi:hypothetical protein